MTHGLESEIAQAADDSLAPEQRHALDAHLTACDSCRALFDTQREARALLMRRPIVPVRDLSAQIRAALDAERPWIDRLNINWRAWSLRVAPIAAALVVVAVMLVRTVDTNTGTSVATNETSVAAADTTASVASALWSGDVSEDTLFNLFLRARPDDALANYVPGTTGVKDANGK